MIAPSTSGRTAVRGRPARTDDWWLARLLTFGGAGAVVAAFALPPALVAGGPVLCPFLWATGLPCPACGLTRSWVSLAHGDLHGSLALHWFGPVLFVLVLVYVVVALMRFGRGRPLPSAQHLAPVRLLLVGFGAVAAYGVLRAALVATGSVTWTG